MSDDLKLVEVLNERSLLGLFLNPASIQEALIKFPLQSFEEGSAIFEEGKPSSSLGIVMSGRARLCSAGNDGATVGLGELTPYRSANLYAVVRGLPFQYSIVAAEKTEVLIIPWDYLKTSFLAKKGLESYLNLMTGSPVARLISKEIEELECSKDFRTEFAGSLVQKSFHPETWITKEGETPTSAFVLFDGTAQVFQKANQKSSGALWAIPKNSWQLWQECLTETPMKYSYRSLLNVQVFTIEKHCLEEIRGKYPEDFEKYEKWVLKSIHAPSAADEVETHHKTLTELFPKIGKLKQWRWSYPHVFQNDMADCGPACLAMIAKFYGKDTPIQFWRDQVFTNREGTTLFDLAKTTERNGFISHGIGVDHLSEIEQSFLPCIALRNDHYSVIYEIKGEKLVVGDPAIGVFNMSMADYEKGFEHAILVLKPKDKFQEISTEKPGMGHYLGLFEGLNKEMFFVFSCSVILVIFSLFPPFLTQIIVDEVLSKKDLKLLIIVLAGAGISVICQAFSYWLREYYVYFLTSKFDFRSNSAFLKKLFSLPYSFFANRHVGDFTRRLSELGRIRGFFSSILINTLLDLALLGLYAVVLFLYSPVICVAGFIAAPMTLLLAHFFSTKLRTKYANLFTSLSKQESLLTDLVKGAGTIKTLNAEVGSRWRYEERLTITLKCQYKLALASGAMSSLTDAYTQLVKFGLMGFGAYCGIKGMLSPGQVVAISMLVGQIVDPFRGLAHNWASFQEMRIIMARLDDVFLASSEVVAGKEGITKSRVIGEIEFQDVWFRYGGDSSEWVLRGASFKIKPGQHVAIVGPSGCGKSTVAHLLARIYEPTKGHILIDGRDYLEYDISWLRSQIGLLQQEPALFYGTISENIAFAQPLFNQEDVIKSAKMTDAHEFITKKTLGYEYVISHGGLGLSGGQKQRLALARTLHVKPSLIVLDEATSMLDGISEAKLLANINSSFKNTTILSIAHRYSTAKTSDFALVMENGRVVGFGTHENLEAEEGLYSQLFGIRGRKVA